MRITTKPVCGGACLDRVESLIDERFYRANGGLGDSRRELAKHYLDEGWKQDLSPHPLFDPSYYRESLGQFDLELPSISPLQHYLENPDQLLVNPHPLFRTSHYALESPNWDTTLEAGLEHYLRVGAYNGLSPHPLFVADHYHSQFGLSDYVHEPGLVHYFSSRSNQSLDPHPLFDTKYYLAICEEARVSPLSPLEYYLRNWQHTLDKQPCRFLDASFLLEQAPVIMEGLSPLEQYLWLYSHDYNPAPNSLFNPKYFARKNRHSVHPDISQLEYFSRRGWENGALISRRVTTLVLQMQGADQGIYYGTYRKARFLVLLFERNQTVERMEALKSKVRQLHRTCEVMVVGPQSACPVSLRDLYFSWEMFEQSGELSSAALATLVHGAFSPFKPYLVVSEKPEKLSPIWSQPSWSLNQFLSSSSIVDQAPQQSTVSARSRRLKFSGRGRVVIPVTGWQISGVNRWVENVSESLKDRGWDVELLATDELYRFGQLLDLPKVPVAHLRAVRTELEYWFAGLRDYLESCAPVVVITAYDFLSNSCAPVMSSSVKFVGVMHSDDPIYYEQTERLGMAFNRIVAVSQFIADKVLDVHPEWKAKIKVIPYGIKPPEIFRSQPTRHPNDPLRIIYTGRIIQEQKRILDLIGVVNALNRIGVNFQLTVVGDGPERQTLEGNLAAEIARNQVEFTGRLRAEEIHQRLAASDVFILVSEFEGLPLSLLEAMAEGCIPVVSDIKSGIPDAITSGETGFILQHRDFDGYARVLQRIATSPELRDTISRNVKAKFYSKFTRDALANSYDDLLDELLHNDPLEMEAAAGRWRLCAESPWRNRSNRWIGQIPLRSVPERIHFMR